MNDLEDYLAALRAAAEQTRIRILLLCAERELTVTELTQLLGQSQPRVSRHLKLMVDAGLLERFREGTWAFYRPSRKSRASALASALVGWAPEGDAVATSDRQRLAAITAERDAQAADYFRRNALEWDRIRKLHADDRLVEARLLERIGDGPIGDLLDVGTGTGRILELLGPRATSGLGIDITREMLSVARSHIEKAGLDHCQVRLGDMYGLSAQGMMFDLIIIHQVLHFADKPALAVAEAARVLRPGGRLFIVDFAPHSLEYLRSEHAHRRLGFRNDDIGGWMQEAGLDPDSPVMIPGDPLTVVIWGANHAPSAAGSMSSPGSVTGAVPTIL